MTEDKLLFVYIKSEINMKELKLPFIEAKSEIKIIDD